MFRLPLLLLVLYYGAAQAFVGAPTKLGSARGKAMYIRGWGSNIEAATVLAAPGKHEAAMEMAMAPPSTSLVLLAEDATAAAPDIPVSPEQQESIISVLSVASSALLLIIISGAVYLSLAEWKNKKELEETAKFTSSGQLPPDIAPEVSRSDPDEEGNRLQRRMAKKEKRKSGKI